MQTKTDQLPNPHETFTHFASFDWAKDHHDVVIVDRSGRIVSQQRIEETAAGWLRLGKTFNGFDAVAVAIETSQGAAVEQLLQLNVAVYPVNPKAAQRYRERKVPSGTKTDLLDAWSLADALRVDGQQWRRLRGEDPLIQELRLLCRDEIQLIGQRTALATSCNKHFMSIFPLL